jgi:pre-60S factor REI1
VLNVCCADDASSGWETASEASDADVAEGGPDDWPDWDPCVSLFDNKVAASMEENLQYMYKTFGFFLPDAEYLADPEGLIKYLGAKLSYGKVRRACNGAHGVEDLQYTRCFPGG